MYKFSFKNFIFAGTFNGILIHCFFALLALFLETNSSCSFLSQQWRVKNCGDIISIQHKPSLKWEVECTWSSQHSHSLPNDRRMGCWMEWRHRAGRGNRQRMRRRRDDRQDGKLLMGGKTLTRKQWELHGMTAIGGWPLFLLLFYEGWRNDDKDIRARGAKAWVFHILILSNSNTRRHNMHIQIIQFLQHSSSLVRLFRLFRPHAPAQVALHNSPSTLESIAYISLRGQGRQRQRQRRRRQVKRRK